jgi:hypothetical protein
MGNFTELVLSNPNACYKMAAGNFDLCAALRPRQVEGECALVLQDEAVRQTYSKTAPTDAHGITYNNGCFEINATDIYLKGVSLKASLLADSCRRCEPGFYSTKGMQPCFPCSYGLASPETLAAKNAMCNPDSAVNQVDVTPNIVKGVQNADYGRSCAAAGDYFACAAPGYQVGTQ